MLIYRCPECTAELQSTTESLLCAGCARSYPIVSGIPILSRNRDYYFGNVPRDTMRHIVTRSGEVGWKRALLEHADLIGRTDFMEYAVSAKRASFKFLLGAWPDARVLDYGCGPGAVSLGLARNFAQVYATDLTLERALFAKTRAEQEGLRNVTVFCSGDTPHIPLPAGCIDIVVLDGVLEWIPETRQGDPRDVHIEFLREIRRLLTARGIVFIGIENRIGFSYVLGMPEDHCRVRFASVMPRKVADWCCRAKLGRPFRTYTYSRPGYRSLLQAAGFSVTDFWGFIPTYQEAERAVRLSDRYMIRSSLNARTREKRARNLIVGPLLPHMVNAFGILSGNCESTPFFSELIGYISHRHLQGEALTLAQYQTVGSEAVRLHLSGKSGPYIVNLPLSPAAEARLQAAVQSAEKLAGIRGLLGVKVRIPEVIAAEKYLGQLFVLQRVPLGRPLDSLIAADNYLAEVCRFLAALCNASRQPHGTWGDALASVAAGYSSALLQELAERRICTPEIEGAIARILAFLRTRAESAAFTCASHGDFCPANVLVLRDELTGVANWELLEWESLPVLDLLHFIIARAPNRRGLGASVLRMEVGLREDSAETRPLREYARAVGIPEEILGCFLVVYWLRQSVMLLQAEDPLPLGAIREAVEGPLARLGALVSSEKSHTSGVRDGVSDGGVTSSSHA